MQTTHSTYVLCRVAVGEVKTQRVVHSLRLHADEILVVAKVLSGTPAEEHGRLLVSIPHGQRHTADD